MNSLKPILAAGLMAACVAFALPATAAPLGLDRSVAASDWRDLRVDVHGGWRRCGFWRRECSFRWGWGSRGFHRCMWRHGC